MLDLIKIRECYRKFGFAVIKNVIKSDEVGAIIQEIYSAKNTIKYYDKNNQLRRIEKLFDKGAYLIKLNDEIKKILNIIFEKKFLIFKDKYNAKPPGGEGFFAHYDGIFKFIDNKNIERNGWYEYADFFTNALIALDECNKENGTIEIASAHKGSFDELLKNTKENGTPDLLPNVESQNNFKIIELMPGDIVIFSNLCPHRSKKNLSKKDRKTLYYTYCLEKDGFLYEKYFNDKLNSKNKTSKSLSGEA
jgi:ectoine hydroxylase-related dioxygenase (phytanoyl-CoA dioxygenase family)